MTRRHARYLAQYPQRIARKRLRRRRLVRGRVDASRMSTRRMRDVLRDWVLSHPRSSEIRPGKKSFMQRMRDVFKPSV